MGDNVALPFPHPRTCPTRAEVFVHKNVIDSIERDIVNTTKEINRLQAHLQYLQQRKANHTSYISPLRCFSPELLSEVVNICLDSDVKLTTLTQVCGTIRDMVVGMSSLWKKILIRAVHPQPMSNLVNQTWRPHGCRTRDQLELVLTRAESSPLEIAIECPPNSDMLKALSSLNYGINSLAVFDSNKAFPNSVHSKDFENLNLRSLRNLHMTDIGCKEAEMLMDLALQSTHEEITLELRETGTMTDSILNHDLIKRVHGMRLWTMLDEPLMSRKITLPNLTWVEITGNQNTFDAFEFRDNGSLEFRGRCVGDGGVNMELSPLPDQMIELSLSCVNWAHKPHQPHIFADLTVLELEYMYIHGTLGDYLKLPSLKDLTLKDIAFIPPESNDNNLEDDDSDLEDDGPDQLFSDTRFLQGAPGLESITLDTLSIDENLVQGLESCTLLKTLSLKYCYFSRFVPRFLEHLQSNEFVPVLDALSIVGSWANNPDMSFEEFRWRFAAKRPNVTLSDIEEVEED